MTLFLVTLAEPSKLNTEINAELLRSLFVSENKCASVVKKSHCSWVSSQNMEYGPTLTQQKTTEKNKEDGLHSNFHSQNLLLQDSA